MKAANFLSERELRSIIATEIPVQYRALAVTYWSILQEIVRRKRLVLVEVDQDSYDAIQRDPTIWGATLAVSKEEVDMLLTCDDVGKERK